MNEDDPGPMNMRGKAMLAIVFAFVVWLFIHEWNHRHDPPDPDADPPQSPW